MACQTLINHFVHANCITEWGLDHVVQLVQRHVKRKCVGINSMTGMVRVLWFLSLSFSSSVCLMCCHWYDLKVSWTGFYFGPWKASQNGQGCYIGWCCSDGDSVTKWIPEAKGVKWKFAGEDKWTKGFYEFFFVHFLEFHVIRCLLGAFHVKNVFLCSSGVIKEIRSLNICFLCVGREEWTSRWEAEAKGRERYTW